MRFFYDLCNQNGWKLFNDVDAMANLIDHVISSCFKKGRERLFQNIIPCQALPDPGVSGIVLGTDFHFTCHTFSKRGTAYIDVFDRTSSSADFLQITNSIIRAYQPSQFVACSDETICPQLQQEFGHHLTFTAPWMSSDQCKALILSTLAEINMHKLAPLTFIGDPLGSYAMIQPITESHIAAHAKDNRIEIDVFSCRPFDDRKVLAIFNKHDNVRIIPRARW